MEAGNAAVCDPPVPRTSAASAGLPCTVSSEAAVAKQRRKDFRYAARAMVEDGRLKQRGLSDSRFLGWLTDSSVWWRHPVCRIAVTWIILIQDFYIYGEDPVNDSHVGANYVGMGNCLGLFTFWSAPTTGESMLKVFLIALAMAGAIFIGRQLITIKLLQERWHINAFYGGEGCVFVVMITFGWTSLAASYVYNFIATDQLDGHSMEVFLLLGAETMQYRHVGKCFQVLSASIDLLTIVMITDAVLQDRMHYQFWAARFKTWYVHGLGGYARVVLCWAVLLGGTVVAAVLIFSTGSGAESGIRWTDTTVGGTSELGRSFLAACIVFTDLLTVLQDWDFPMFREPLDVEVPVMIAGTTAVQIRCSCIESCLSSLPQLPSRLLAWLPSSDIFAVSIRGKWLAYGPLLGVMGVDFMCAKTQMLYDPLMYGQYADPASGRVWMIVDPAYLNLAYARGNILNASMISWEARRNIVTGDPLDASASTDVWLNSRYYEEPGTRYLALVVSLAVLASFCWLLWMADWQRLGQIERQASEIERQTLQQNDASSGADCRVLGQPSLSPVQGPDEIRQASDEEAAPSMITRPAESGMDDRPEALEDPEAMFSI